MAECAAIAKNAPSWSTNLWSEKMKKEIVEEWREFFRLVKKQMNAEYYERMRRQVFEDMPELKKELENDSKTH